MNNNKLLVLGDDKDIRISFEDFQEARKSGERFFSARDTNRSIIYGPGHPKGYHSPVAHAKEARTWPLAPSYLVWPDLIGAIFQDQKQNSPNPGTRIWELLQLEIRDLITNSIKSGKFTRTTRARVTDALNGVLDQRGFYQKADFNGIIIPKRAHNLIQRILPRNFPTEFYQELNFLLVKAAYPKGIVEGIGVDDIFTKIVIDESDSTNAQSKTIDDELIRNCFKQGLIGVSPFIIDHVFVAIRDCSTVESPVLITGETGTGKEVVAKCICKLSKRGGRPFKEVNCGGIPSTLLESELFGHEKGAFTGATERKEGLLKAADGGVLFLDEIGDMPIELQVKLLRFLNDGGFYRVGGTKKLEVDVRVIAATNKNIEVEVSNGNFRSDLLYRLNTMELNIWPLYLRPSDLPLLTYYFIKKHGQNIVNYVSPFFMRQVILNRWKGNVREMQNQIERACNIAISNERTCLHFLEWDRHTSELLAPYFGERSEIRRIILERNRENEKKGNGEYLGQNIEIDDLPTLDVRYFMSFFDEDLGPHFRKPWGFNHRVKVLAEEKQLKNVGDDRQSHVLQENLDQMEWQSERQLLDCYYSLLFETCQKNRTRAARAADVSVDKLRAKWKKLDLIKQNGTTL